MPEVRIACECLEAEGFDVLYIDCTPGGAVGIVKAIVPGLEVETMSYSCIGERKTHKLIECHHPPTTFGRPSDMLLPVRLMPEAISRSVGGQPLPDIVFAEQIIGNRYPLYREPESHNAPFRDERRDRHAGREST